MLGSDTIPIQIDQHASTEIATQVSAAEVFPFQGLRVLIVHDWIASWAGSERCLEQMLAIFPTADVVVGMVAPDIRNLNDTTKRARETWLARIPGARRHHRWFLPLQGLAFASLNTDGYDLVISSAHAFAKAVRVRGNAIHVCYCHSPPRYLWDLKSTYAREATLVQRVALDSSTRILRRFDRWAAQQVHHFICNSHYIAARIKRCYGRDADVVYPPVAGKPLHEPPPPRGDFLLSFGRLVPYKRVDLAILAAERLGVRLVVAGDGPERKKLEALAGPHTEFVGEVPEETAARLMSTCAALVFCAEEDFGITPVEANAHGAPVVAFGRGGVLETMEPGVTAELFAEQDIALVVSAMERVLSKNWSVQRLMANAARFGPEKFRRSLTASVQAALDGYHTSKAALATLATSGV